MKIYAKCEACGMFDEVTPTGDVPDPPKGWMEIQYVPPLPARPPYRKDLVCGPCFESLAKLIKKFLTQSTKV